MVYNPKGIATSYLGGLQMGEERKIRGLDQARIKREQAAKAKAAAKTAQIEGLTSRLAQGDETARAGLMGLGSEGIAGAQTFDTYQLGQTKTKRDTETFDRDTANRELEQNLPRALTITDPAEWDKFEAWARPRSLAAGVDPAMYDQLASQPMEEAQSFLRQQMEGKPEALPVGGLRTVRKKDNSQVAYDVTTEEGRKSYMDEIAAGGQEIKPIGREEAGGVGGFAQGSSSEMKTIRADILTSQDNTANLMTYIDDIQGIIEETPDVNALGGSLARVGINLLADIKSAARLVGGDAQEDADRLLAETIGDSRSELFDLGIENGRAQSAIIGLAYQAALQANQRVTDADFKAALKEIGASYSDPKLFSKVLDDYANRAIGRYENMYTSRRDMYGPDAKIGKMKSFERKGGGKAKDFSKMTAKELSGLNPANMTKEEVDAAEAAWEALNATN